MDMTLFLLGTSDSADLAPATGDAALAWGEREDSIHRPATVAQFSTRDQLGSGRALSECRRSRRPRHRKKVTEKSSVALKRVKPRKRHSAADHHLNQGGREEHDPKGATRRQKPREEESSREQRRGENPEHGESRPGRMSRGAGRALAGNVLDHGHERGDGDSRSSHANRQPERAVGPEKEKCGARCRDGRHCEDSKEKDAVSEVVHGAVRLPVRPARGGDVDGNHGGGDEEGADVPGSDQSDFGGGSHRLRANRTMKGKKTLTPR